MNYSKKLSNFEDVSEGYFQKNENDEEFTDTEPEKTKKKSFWKSIFGK
jgi:hypothetical protein